MGQRASCSGGGFLVVFRSGKWILQFSYTVLNKQNCKFPYGTAMWDSVPVGPVAASCLWTCTFALIERQSLLKNNKQTGDKGCRRRETRQTRKQQRENRRKANRREGTRDEAKPGERRAKEVVHLYTCLLYTSPSPRDVEESRMPSSA